MHPHPHDWISIVTRPKLVEIAQRSVIDSPTATGANGKLTVLNDVNGHQVTYNGHPLYTFADDHTGQVTGQGIQNFFVATPSLTPLTTSPAGTPPTAPTTGNPGY